MKKKISDKTAKKIAKEIERLPFKSDKEKESAMKKIACALEAGVLATDVTGHVKVMLDAHQQVSVAHHESAPKTDRQKRLDKMDNLNFALQAMYDHSGLDPRERKRSKDRDTRRKTPVEMRTPPVDGFGKKEGSKPKPTEIGHNPPSPNKDQIMKKIQENKKDILQSKKDLIMKKMQENKKDNLPSKKDLIMKKIRENKKELLPSDMKKVEREFRTNKLDMLGDRASKKDKQEKVKRDNKPDKPRY